MSASLIFFFFLYSFILKRLQVIYQRSHKFRKKNVSAPHYYYYRTRGRPDMNITRFRNYLLHAIPVATCWNSERARDLPGGKPNRG